mmetsp:Transcript_15045/g.27169  ORF Transcript_15045/g.27169 Transcript_15045/m.27169 type:complete len:244 (+) Transcript_15045:506-1237(+)
MAVQPAFLLDGPSLDIRWEAVCHFGLVPALLVLRTLRRLLRCLMGLVPQRMPSRLEVNENVGVEPSLQRKRTAMQHRVTLVQDHVSRLHCHVVRLSIMRINLDGPRLIHVLIDVDDGGRHERHAIHVGGEDGSLGVNADTIEGAFRNLLAGPLLHGVLGGVPDLAFDVGSRTAKAGVLDGDHVGGGVPVIRVSIPLGPILILPILLILIIVPKLLDAFPHFRWRPHLFEPQLRVILHARRLPK